MKTKIFAYTALFTIIAVVILNTYRLNREMRMLSEGIEALDTESADALATATAAKERFEARAIFISLSVGHDDLAIIEEGFAELVGALSVGDTNEAKIIKSRLKNSFEHLRRLSGFSLDSII